MGLIAEKIVRGIKHQLEFLIKINLSGEHREKPNPERLVGPSGPCWRHR